MERELREGGVGDVLMELRENPDQPFKEPFKELNSKPVQSQ